MGSCYFCNVKCENPECDLEPKLSYTCQNCGFYSEVNSITQRCASCKSAKIVYGDDSGKEGVKQNLFIASLGLLSFLEKRILSYQTIMESVDNWDRLFELAGRIQELNVLKEYVEQNQEEV